MSTKLASPSDSKRGALRRMVNKEVRVVADGEWSGIVVSVVDEENLLILKHGKKVRVNIFDVRSK